MDVRSGLWLPLFDALADPRLTARLAAEAEEAGWDGVFVWDHLRWRAPVVDTADPWITLAAMATATERVRLGPMVTPLARRRPVKVAKEVATLDVLSGGRVVLGVGLGSDRFGLELSSTGEELDDRVRAELLDECLEVIRAVWSGDEVSHHGRHHTVSGAAFGPPPVQGAGLPVWVAGFPGRPRPMRRAAAHDGYFPVNLEHPDQLAEALDVIRPERERLGRTGEFDVVVGLAPGVDPEPWVAAGATWWLPELDPEAVGVDAVRGLVRDGPLR